MLSVASFNCRNLKTSVPEIRKLCDSNDIVLLQETWLTNDELHMIATLDDRFYGQGISFIDSGAQVLIKRAATWWNGCIVAKINQWLYNNRHAQSKAHEDTHRKLRQYNSYIQRIHAL